VPAIPVVGIPVQVSWSLEGAVTVKVPQLAVLLLPPQLAVAVTEYVFAVGLVQLKVVGAHVMPVVSVVLPHLTVGCVIAVPAIPDATKPVQVSDAEALELLPVPPASSQFTCVNHHSWST